MSGDTGLASAACGRGAHEAFEDVVLLQLIERLEAIILESVKPLEQIEGLEILDIRGAAALPLHGRDTCRNLAIGLLERCGARGKAWLSRPRSGRSPNR
jgi:hypothetical protein